jgi:hypothetical protein
MRACARPYRQGQGEGVCTSRHVGFDKAAHLVATRAGVNYIYCHHQFPWLGHKSPRGGTTPRARVNAETSPSSYHSRVHLRGGGLLPSPKTLPTSPHRSHLAPTTPHIATPMSHNYKVGGGDDDGGDGVNRLDYNAFYY